jgi:hypothetical protein
MKIIFIDQCINDQFNFICRRVFPSASEQKRDTKTLLALKFLLDFSPTFVYSFYAARPALIYIATRRKFKGLMICIQAV